MLGMKKYRQLLSLVWLLLFGTAAGQETPSDYQEVLQSFDRKGDFKDGVLKGEHSPQRPEDDRGGSFDADAVRIRRMVRLYKDE